MRRHVTSKVFEYGKAVCEQNKLREEMKLKEPRSSEEQMRARDLLQIVLEFDEKVKIVLNNMADLILTI